MTSRRQGNEFTHPKVFSEDQPKKDALPCTQQASLDILDDDENSEYTPTLTILPSQPNSRPQKRRRTGNPEKLGKPNGDYGVTARREREGFGRVSGASAPSYEVTGPIRSAVRSALPRRRGNAMRDGEYDDDDDDDD